jgi:hypothetical protein
MWCTVSECRRWRIHRYVTEPFEELFGFVRAKAIFPVHEVILVNKILATLSSAPFNHSTRLWILHDAKMYENVRKLH